MLTMNQKTSSQNHDFAGLEDWFEIFRSGTHVDSLGRKKTFTDSDLDSMVANHNADEPAPLVVGHPKDNDPAYGWSAGLKAEGGKLFAKGKDIIAEFSDAVEKKMYPNRSVSIVPTEDGGWKVRHIGFLGAKAPAVSGLAGINFSVEGDDAFEFAMSDEQRWGTSRGFRAIGRILRRLRDIRIEEKGLEDADRVIPDYDIESIESIAQDIGNSDLSPSRFSTHEPTPASGDIVVDPNSDKQFTQADIDAAVLAALAQPNKELGDLKYQARLDKAVELVNGMVGEGRLLPAQVPGLAEFMASLSGDDAGAFEFAAAEEGAAPVKKTPAVFMAEFMAGMGKQIQMGADTSEGPDADAAEYQAPQGYTVDAERAKLHNKALDYQAQHNCEYIVAVRAVQNQGEK